MTYRVRSAAEPFARRRATPAGTDPHPLLPNSKFHYACHLSWFLIGCRDNTITFNYASVLTTPCFISNEKFKEVPVIRTKSYRQRSFGVIWRVPPRIAAYCRVLPRTAASCRGHRAALQSAGAAGPVAAGRI